MDEENDQQRLISEMPMPVGYRFKPTDEELVMYYLMNKVFYRPVPAQITQEIDAAQLYSKPPSSLVTFSDGEREMYFFIREVDDFLGENYFKERKVGDGVGFWKVNGREIQICNSDGSVFASKFRLTYFSGSTSKAKKTIWKMDEYRLPAECYAAGNLEGVEWVLGRLMRGRNYRSCF